MTKHIIEDGFRDIVRINTVGSGNREESVVVDNANSTDIRTQEGNDEIIVNNVTARADNRPRSIFIHAGSGNDLISIWSATGYAERGPTATTGAVFGGKGNDVIEYSGDYNDRSQLSVNGGAGRDRFLVDHRMLDMDFRAEGGGVYTLSGPNGTTITLRGIEQIGYRRPENGEIRTFDPEQFSNIRYTAIGSLLQLAYNNR